MLIKVNSHSTPWLFTTVYASPTLSKLLKFWEFLIELANTHQLPWLMMGDFNKLLESADKIGGRALIPSRVQAFDNCLKRCGLLSLLQMGLIALGLIKPETGPNTIKKNLTEPFATMIGNFFFHRLRA